MWNRYCLMNKSHDLYHIITTLTERTARLISWLSLHITVYKEYQIKSHSDVGFYKRNLINSINEGQQ